MTVYELKANHERLHPKSHFFDADTLKFFGEKLSEMRVLAKTEEITDVSGNRHTCYVLSHSQRGPFGKKIRRYSYFDIKDFSEVIT